MLRLIIRITSWLRKNEILELKAKNVPTYEKKKQFPIKLS